MNHLLLQIVALASSVLLTLPVGWCNRSAALTAADHPSVPSCCSSACAGTESRHLEGAAVPRGPLPAEDCCCQWEATVPQKTLPAEADSGLLLPTAFALAGHAPGPRVVAVTTSPNRSGPRLHVLHCVWRC